MAFNWYYRENENRLLPILHEDIWKLKKNIESSSWLATEIDLSKDRLQWLTLSQDEQKFVKYQIAFFIHIDIAVIDTIDKFSDYIDCIEAKFYYIEQNRQEAIHAESYALQAEAIMSGAELDEIQNSISTMPIIKKIYDWIHSYSVKNNGIEVFLVVMACTEGILFSASFAALQWLRENNKLHGITAMNEFIVRDENLHTSMSTLLISKYVKNKPSFDIVTQIVQSLIAIIDEFIEEAIPVKLLGMNAENMKDYVRFRADIVLNNMNYITIYDIKNPFKFMQKLELNRTNKTNFFENPNSAYHQAVDPNLTLFRYATDEEYYK